MGPQGGDGVTRSIIDDKSMLLQRSLDHIQLGIEEAQVNIVTILSLPLVTSGAFPPAVICHIHDKKLCR